MRVLHVIDPGSPGGGACTLQLLAQTVNRIRSVAQDVLVVGSVAHADLARRCGVEPVGVVTPALRQPALARRAVERTLELLETAGGPYDVLHAWTMPSAILITMLGHRRHRLGTLTVGPVSGLNVPLLKRQLDRHPTRLLCASTAVAREYHSMGIGFNQLGVLAPGVDLESVTCIDRKTLRRRWHVDDRTLVMGLLSEPVSWADARTAINTTIRAAATGRPVRLLVHPQATRRVEAEQWAATLGHRDAIIVDDEVAEPWRVVRGLDAALLIGGDLNSSDLTGAGSPFAWFTGGGRRLRPMPGFMPLLWAMAAGVPIIAEASDAVRDVIVDGQSGLLVEHDDLNAVSDRIIRISDDPTIASRIGHGAREAARQQFHISAFTVQLKDAYERLLGPRLRPTLAEAAAG